MSLGFLYKDFVVLHGAAFEAIDTLRRQILAGRAERMPEYDTLVTQLERLQGAASVCRIEANGHISGDPEAARDKEIEALHAAGTELARDLGKAARLLIEGRDREALRETLHMAEKTNLQMALCDAESHCKALAEDVHALKAKVKELELALQVPEPPYCLGGGGHFD